MQVPQFISRLNSPVVNILLLKGILLLAPDNVLDARQQKHATIIRIILLWIVLSDFDEMWGCVKPIRKGKDLFKGLFCAGSCVVFRGVRYAVVDGYFVVDYAAEEPVAIAVYCDY